LKPLTLSKVCCPGRLDCGRFADTLKFVMLLPSITGAFVAEAAEELKPISVLSP
jgi:hypothetical protein